MVDYDKIGSSHPVNRQAALSTSKGFEYTPDKKVQTADSDVPIPIRVYPKSAGAEHNLTGRKFGRFTVLGLARDVENRWVVKCSCGTFTLRKAKSIKNPQNSEDRCEHCRHLEYLKRADHYLRYGYNKE